MKKIGFIFTILILSYTSLLQASKIQVIGSGEIITKPDQVQFSIMIQSKCYATVQEASESSDKVANNLFQELNKIFPKKDERNQISTQGGFTQRFEAPQYQNRPRECENTFQKVTSISVMTTEIDRFENLFNQVQNVVYQNQAPKTENMISKAITFVTMSEPTAMVSFQTNQQLETQALDKALKNAMEKAKQLVGDKAASSLKIVEIAESLPAPAPAPMRSMMRGMAMEMSASSAPISFENNRIEKSLSVIFEF